MIVIMGANVGIISTPPFLTYLNTFGYLSVNLSFSKEVVRDAHVYCFYLVFFVESGKLH